MWISDHVVNQFYQCVPFSNTNQRQNFASKPFILSFTLEALWQNNISSFWKLFFPDISSGSGISGQVSIYYSSLIDGDPSWRTVLPWPRLIHIPQPTVLIICGTCSVQKGGAVVAAGSAPDSQLQWSGFIPELQSWLCGIRTFSHSPSGSSPNHNDIWVGGSIGLCKFLPTCWWMA